MLRNAPATARATDPVLIHGFVCRIINKSWRSRTIVALHGSGADETTLLPFARAVDPDAGIVAPRGRIDQNGERRWFLKHSPICFDQASIRTEAAAFAVFVRKLADFETVDPGRTVFIGYSNGGNLVHATMMLHADVVRTAILLRCMPVLARAQMSDLSECEVLCVRGGADETYRSFAAPLAAQLRRRGASVALRTVTADHMLGDEDVAVARRWLGRIK
ncbi:MAG: alpha/beta hydrolase [Pseudorhodoplanes sp.]